MGKENETSTWSIGTPHNVDVFHPVTFASSRKVTPGNRDEVDTRLWKNGSFNELAKKPQIPKHWKLKDGKVPAFWALSSAAQYGGEMEMLLHPDSRDNYFLRLRNGFIFQGYELKNDKLRVGMRVRGRGKLEFSILRQTAKYKGLGTVKVKTLNIDSKDWTQVSFDFDCPSPDKTEKQSLMVWPRDGEIDIDDLYLTGL